MVPLSIIGVFCEDIRVETGDILTLVGLMPDNINVAPLDSDPNQKGGVAIDQRKFLTKLYIYTRAIFDPDDPIEEIELRLVLPDEKEVSLGGASPDVIEKAKQQAKENEGPLAGVVMRSLIQPFQLPGPGILRLESIIGSEVRLISFLNFKMLENANSSNASAQRS